MSSGAALLLAVVLGALLPYVVTRALLRSLSSASGRALTENYRGQPVVLGLGAAWLAWGIGALGVGGLLIARADGVGPGVVLAVFGGLALAASSVGLFDDAYGTRGSRGFRGHLTALAHGELTTGGLKVIGIGAASLLACAVVGAALDVWGDGARGALAMLLAGASVALTANLVNLSDLRPGRAHKLYVLLALTGLLLTPLGPLSSVGPVASGPIGWFALAVLALGPLAATWGPDVSERAMLGDAGANAMGAVAGMLVACSLPLPALVGWTGVVVALNLASERVSFSALIERNRVLSWIDGLGRRAG